MDKVLQKFLLGTKRGPMKKSEKCVKWIWDPKNCPLDYIKKGDEYKKVKKGCETNEPTDHCKNCSYKELVPILSTSTL